MQELVHMINGSGKLSIQCQGKRMTLVVGCFSQFTYFLLLIFWEQNVQAWRILGSVFNKMPPQDVVT
jgi:hypothetical protein